LVDASPLPQFFSIDSRSSKSRWVFTLGSEMLTAKEAGLGCLACDDSLIETRLQVHAKSRSLESMRLCRRGVYAIAPHEARRLAARTLSGNMETAPSLGKAHQRDPRVKALKCLRALRHSRRLLDRELAESAMRLRALSLRKYETAPLCHARGVRSRFGAIAR
jgi:hypothetical protein